MTEDYISIRESWPKANISPCCQWYSNPRKKDGYYRCIKCGKEW